tara:strand:- start:956 stop:1099 length:144 start_codon:yes stop_codon:yes gene_type:complete
MNIEEIREEILRLLSDNDCVIFGEVDHGVYLSDSSTGEILDLFEDLV